MKQNKAFMQRSKEKKKGIYESKKRKRISSQLIQAVSTVATSKYKYSQLLF